MRCPGYPYLLAVALLSPLPARAQATVTTLDASGTVGLYSDVAYGPDGLALISYFDQTNGALKVAHCQDVACTTASLATLDAANYVGLYTSVAFGSDGLGLISYYEEGAGINRVKVAHCTDAACSSPTVSVVGPATGGSTGIAVGTDGLGVVAYGNDNLKLAVGHCTDVPCTSLTVASFPTVWARDISLSIGGDGLPLIVAAYAQVVMFHCQNVTCTAAGVVGLGPLPFGTPLVASVATGADGLGVLGVQASVFVGPPNGTESFVSVARCSDAVCSTITMVHTLTDSPDDLRPAVAMLPGDQAVLAFAHVPASGLPELRVARCATRLCVGATVEVPDVDVAFSGLSVAISPQGGTLVSYQGGGHLKAAYLPPEPAPGSADLGLSITASPDPANPGLQLSYTLLVTNNGPQDAVGVLVSDQLAADLGNLFVEPVLCSLSPSGAATCDLGTIPAGESRSVTVGGMPKVADLETLTNQASVTASGSDPNQANNAASITTAVNPWLRLVDTAVVEGTSGSSDAVFLARLSRPSASSVSVTYSTEPITATAGVDYLTTSGTLSFAPGTTSASFAVPIVTDSLIEDDERFRGNLSIPQGAGLGIPFSYATILDDDAPTLSRVEVNHGTSLAADMGPGGAQAGVAYFRVAVPPYSSYEAVVDAVSPDVAPVHLVRLAPDGHVSQMANESPGSARLPWMNQLPLTVVNETLRVTGACGAACDAGDRYRLRLYDTTMSVPRFDNAGGQRTVVIVANPTLYAMGVYLQFFDESGEFLVSTSLLGVQPRGSLVLDTTGDWAHDLLVGRSGSVRIANFAPYGALTGKAVILDPVSGSQTETPMAARPH